MRFGRNNDRETTTSPYTLTLRLQQLSVPSQPEAESVQRSTNVCLFVHSLVNEQMTMKDVFITLITYTFPNHPQSL